MDRGRATVMKLPAGTRFYTTFPLHMSPKVTHEVVVENLREQGFVRIAADGDVYHLDELEKAKIDLPKVKEVLVVIDRLSRWCCPS